jgi:hypothetical protein
MVARGLADAEQVAHAIALLDDPGFRLTLPLMISAWGRRPG